MRAPRAPGEPAHAPPLPSRPSAATTTEIVIRLRTPLALLALALASPAAVAFDQARAQRSYARHCAVCHGADRAGYLAPALDRDGRKLGAGEVEGRILGGAAAPRPAHPSWRGVLGSRERALLAELVTTQPARHLAWGMDEIGVSLQVFVADEATLPAAPRYAIERLDDLVVVMGRGEHAAGDAAKLVFFDGHAQRRLGEAPTAFAPRTMEFHPGDPRWAWFQDEAGYVHRLDLHSLRVVRKVRAGLNGGALAVSRDGRHLAAISQVPHALVILDAATLEPRRLIELPRAGPDGRTARADADAVLATAFAERFVVVLGQAGQVWIVDPGRPDAAVERITGAGQHLAGAFLSPGGSYLATAARGAEGGALIDLEAGRVVRRIPAGCEPRLGAGAVTRVQGRLLGFAVGLGTEACARHEVAVFDMASSELLKRIALPGPAAPPLAHPAAPWVIVPMLGGPEAGRLHLIDRESLEPKTVPELADLPADPASLGYTARGEAFYLGTASRNEVLVFDAHTLRRLKSFPLEAPGGIFTRSRTRSVAIGLRPGGGGEAN